eukprot:9026175-Pyramimonas_sp.AAC.1
MEPVGIILLRFSRRANALHRRRAPLPTFAVFFGFQGLLPGRGLTAEARGGGFGPFDFTGVRAQPRC